MKKLIVMALLATMLITFVGCGNKNTDSGTTSTTATTVQTSTVSTSTVNSSEAANIYDGTGEKQGEKLVSIKWSEKDKIKTINNMLHTNNAITKSGEGKSKTFKASDADKIYLVELVNNNYANNYFFVYIINNRVYMLGEDFAKNDNAEISGYADVTVDEFNNLLK